MLLTIVMTLVLHCSDRGVTVGAVRCQAGHFISQGPARVTCLFHTNVFQTKHNFVVEMYRSRSTQSVPEIPLLCSWLVPEKPDCVIKEGYSFDYHITDRLTLNIPNVTQAFAGLYVCRLVPPDGMPAPQCNLTVQDARREDETELPSSPTTIVTDTEPESQRRECPGVDTAVMFVLVQGYVLLLFASILIHIGIHRSYTTGSRRRGNACQRNNPENSPDATPLSEMNHC